ncbi:MAG: nitrilase-related carbon-nitrogen hydrolase [Amaricoccus sp.]
MKVAAAAYSIDWHNRWNEFVGKLRVWVRTAAENGAELLVFPQNASLELASLAREENAKDLKRAVEAVNARIKDVDELQASLAREFGVHLCAGSAPVGGPEGRVVNRVRLFAPNGKVGQQGMRFPTPAEIEAGIAPGQIGRVFQTTLGRIGILPGPDAAHPALAQAMVEAGAEILLAPVSTPTLRSYWRARIGAMARALESNALVVQAVTIGDADWLATATRSVGAAGIYAPPLEGLPDDGIVAAGKMNAAGWVYGEVDLSPLRAARAAPLADPAPAGDLAAIELVGLTDP